MVGQDMPFWPPGGAQGRGSGQVWEWEHVCQAGMITEILHGLTHCTPWQMRELRWSGL